MRIDTNVSDNYYSIDINIYIHSFYSITNYIIISFQSSLRYIDRYMIVLPCIRIYRKINFLEEISID